MCNIFIKMLINGEMSRMWKGLPHTRSFFVCLVSHVCLLCSRYWLSVRHEVKWSCGFPMTDTSRRSFFFSFFFTPFPRLWFSFQFTMIFKLIIDDRRRKWWRCAIMKNFNLFNIRCNSYYFKIFYDPLVFCNDFIRWFYNVCFNEFLTIWSRNKVDNKNISRRSFTGAMCNEKGFKMTLCRSLFIDRLAHGFIWFPKDR